MPVINTPDFNFHQWATDKVFEVMRASRIGKKKAEKLSRIVVDIAGPGKGHRAVKYRIAPANGGWWMTEAYGGDAHEAPKSAVKWVPEKAVKKLWRVIKKAFPKSAKYRLATDSSEVPASYRFDLPAVVPLMAKAKMLPKHFNTKTFYAGKNRNLHYMPKYLYPMRVLDFLGRIRFGGTSWRLE